jgi:aspartyl-tRNA(Asn)/glutamyl-tRNA(Gln) amidotransferase subunit A
MDHPGPMAQNVMDLALLLRPMGWSLAGNNIDLVERASVASSKPRLARLRQLFDERADTAVREMMDELAHRLGQDGAQVTDFALPAEFSDVIQRHRIVMAVESAQYHEARLRRHPEDYGPCITGLLQEGLACTAPELARTKEHQNKLSLAMRMMLHDDIVLLCPATTGPAPLADTTGDPAFNSPWSYTGLPTISIQTGYYENDLPLAIQLVAGPNREDLLFSVAVWCEKRLAPSPLVPKLPA